MKHIFYSKAYEKLEGICEVGTCFITYAWNTKRSCVRRNRSGRKRRRRRRGGRRRRRRKHAHVPVSEYFDTSTEIIGQVIFVSLDMSAFYIRASYWRRFAFDSKPRCFLYLWFYYSFLRLFAANHVKCLLHSLERICHCHITTRRFITPKKLK